MSNDIKVQGIRITLDDKSAPVTEDAAIGLSNTVYELSGRAIYNDSDGAYGYSITWVSGDDYANVSAGDTVSIGGETTTVVTKWSSTKLSVNVVMLSVEEYDFLATITQNSVIQWIQNTVTGLTEWVAGIIIESGLSPWTKAIDLSKGGNVSAPGSFSVSVKNTVQLFKTLRAAGIEPVGLKIELVEFVNGTENIRAVGKIRSISFDVESYNIEAEGSYNDRDTAVTSKDSEGNAVPIHLGAFDGSTGYNYAKCVRTAFKNQNIKGSDIPGMILTGVDTDNETFCIVSGDNHYSDSAAPALVVGLAKSLELISSSTVAAFLVGKYLSITVGENSGEIRRIISIDDYDEANGTITLELSAAFPAAFTALADNWCNILDFSMTLSLDSKTSIGLSGSLSDFYIYNNGYVPQANLLFDAVNTFSISPVIDFANGSPSSLKTLMLIKPAVSAGATDTEYWGGFFVGKNLPIANCSFGADGFYNYETFTKTDHFNNAAYAIDQNISTFLSMYSTVASTEMGAGRVFIFLIDLDIGNLVKGVSYDNAYLIYSSAPYSTANLTISAPITMVMRRRFYGKEYLDTVGGVASLVWTYNWNSCGELLNSVTTDNIIDYYVSRSGYDKNFMQSNAGKHWTLPAGLEDSTIRMQMQITAVPTAVGTFDIGIKINELAIALEKTVNLEDGFFCKFSGRIFDNTWNSRKTSASLMASPIDFLEHFLRLANWSEIDPMPSTGWGTAYSPSAKIKTSGTGSFDSTLRGLDTLRAWSLCWANYDYDAARVLEIAKEICTQFDLMLWVDKDGYYCIDRYKPSLTMTGLPKITLANIPADERKNISVEYPQPSDIYCEPVINYNWDEGAQKFQSRLAITNSSAETYSSTYVTGITDAALAERLWNLCHLLWKRARMVTEMPSELSDCKWFNGVNAYEAAVEHIQNVVNHQFYPTINQVIDLDQAIDWTECTRFVANYPHQTDGVDVECLVEEIECNRAEMKASVKAKMIQYSTTKTFSAVPLTSPTIGVVRLSLTGIEDYFIVGQQMTLSAVMGHGADWLEYDKPYFVKAVGTGYIDIEDKSGFEWDVNVTVTGTGNISEFSPEDPIYAEWVSNLSQDLFGAVDCSFSIQDDPITSLSLHGTYNYTKPIPDPATYTVENVNIQYTLLTSGAQVNITTQY